MGSGLSGQDLSQRRTRASTSAAITTTAALLFCLCLFAGEVTTGGPVANGTITPQPRAQIDHRIVPLISRASDRSPAPVMIRFIGKRSNRLKTNRNTEGAFAEGWRARKLQATENLIICVREIISSRLDTAIMKRGPPLRLERRAYTVFPPRYFRPCEVTAPFPTLDPSKRRKIQMAMVEALRLFLSWARGISITLGGG